MKNFLKYITDKVTAFWKIADEVARNKLKVVHELLREDFGCVVEQPNIAIPHLLLASDQRTTLANHIDSYREAAALLQETMTESVTAVMKMVSGSSDGVSVMLQPILDRAELPTEEELARARLRRELGRSPGKFRDALGDQVIWEQLLARLRPEDPLWIISRDGDLVTSHSGICVLNPSLRAEVSSRMNHLDHVFCFDNLLQGLAHYQRHVGRRSEHFPSDDEAVQIAEELRTLMTRWRKGHSPPFRRCEG